MFPNHQGLFDTLALFESHEKPFSAVVKKMEHVFLVKQIIRLIKAQLMDQEDVRQSLQVIKQVAEEVKEGRRYIYLCWELVLPNGNQMQDFKAGTFKKCNYGEGARLYPVALIDTFKHLIQIQFKKNNSEIILYGTPYMYENTKEYRSQRENPLLK